MPCTNSTVKRKCVEEYIRQVPLTSFLSKQDIDSVKSYCQNMVWNNIPGGFTTNKPQRGTNAFGDGSGYDEHGVIGKKSELGYYTGAINQSDTTLVTKTEPLPKELQMLGLGCRKLVADLYPKCIPDSYMFNIAVANLYTESHHNIAAHTDDNEFYSRNPIIFFASLTLYPDTKPSEGEYARFQVCLDGKWIDMQLENESVLFMPSFVPHRVLPALKNKMHKRINITLRSLPSLEDDPLSSLAGVSNHARYYRKPHRLLVPSDKDRESVLKLQHAFGFDCVSKTETKQSRALRRKHLISQIKIAYKKKSKKCIRFGSNLTNELLERVLDLL